MDEKQNCINEIVSALIMRGFSQEQISVIHGTIQLTLAEYNVEKANNEIIPYEGDFNEQLLQKFIITKRVAGRSNRTLNFYYNEVSKALRRLGKHATEVTADDIRLLLAKREIEDKVSKVTLNNERRALSSFYTWLRDEGIVRINPVHNVEPIKGPKRKKKAFSEIELEKIRNAARTNRETAIIETLYSTGCRITELVSIKIEDIKEGAVTIIGKGDKERTVYINAKAIIAITNYLAERKDKNEYLFPSGKGFNREKTERKAQGKTGINTRKTLARDI